MLFLIKKNRVKYSSFFISLLFFSNTLYSQKLLELLNAEKCGINFKNTIQENGIYNHVVWDYVYNGAGVATGDLNNDGLADIFFAGNQVDDRLYLNQGNFQFKDITKNLNAPRTHFWSAGVTMADVNADGWLDIYVSKFEPSPNPADRKNLLYINNGLTPSPLGVRGEITFTEKAQEYGIADAGYSIQSSFFDMDNDGDLDLFVVNQPTSNNNEKMKDRENPTPCTETNRLYRNDTEVSLLQAERKGGFTDVTLSAGVTSCAYGLGLVVSDLNNDGWQDIYVSNDYFTSDDAWINQKNGTFRNEAKALFKHQSLYSMGVDIADFNNDGFMDIYTADMSAPDHYRNKANMASMNTQRFDNIIQHFNHQYMFNALQINRGTPPLGGQGGFNDIAQLAGVANTDWSWSTLFIDIDNDTQKDIFVTNGIKRDIRFVDGMNKIREMVASGTVKLSEVLAAIPSQKLKNYAFKNESDYHFSNASDEWGFGVESFSNGMAYADFDNDGDLDLVINNVDDLPFIFKNNSKNNFLSIALKGEANNPFSYGSKATIFYSGSPLGVRGKQVQELSVTRGFLSSSEPTLHFGLGKIKKIDSLIIQWKGNKSTKLFDKDISINTKVEIRHNDVTFYNSSNQKNQKTLFSEKNILDVAHYESAYNDFKKEVLLPNKLSEIGPALAVADVNNDGLDDVFLGGGKGQSSRLFIQNQDETFGVQTFDDGNQEKTEALFFDANNDGKLDLYVASASNEFAPNDPNLQDKLYLNQDGKFVLDALALPEMLVSTGAATAADFDNDGDQDVFVGGMMMQQKYPYPNRSFLLENKKGKFSDITPDALKNIGMVRDAIWTDFDNDKDLDLMMVGEWMVIELFENKKGKLERKAALSLEKTRGFWHKIVAEDMDNDGDVDYIVGNLGLNNKFKKDSKKHFHVFSCDFDENGVNDVVLGKEDASGKLLPVRGRECSSQQMPFIAEKFKTYDQFAKSGLKEIYPEEKLKNALHYEINEMGSIYLENLGKGNFSYKLLPTLAQFSVISDILVTDFDQDGKKDILAVGNKYEAEVETARYDASVGCFLKGDNKGNFQAIPAHESGFYVNENSRAMQFFKTKKGKKIVVGVNNGKLRWFDF